MNYRVRLTLIKVGMEDAVLHAEFSDMRAVVSYIKQAEYLAEHGGHDIGSVHAEAEVEAPAFRRCK